MDSIAYEGFNYGDNATQICEINPNYKIWPEFEQADLKNKVIAYLKNQELISITFTLNQLRGTPSMIVFNDKYEILYNKFGHIYFQTIQAKLSNLIDNFN